MTKQIRLKNKWSSTLGFILATSGAAIGLGNIQRFPYIVAQEGGASFVLIYLVCIFLLGFPLILSEFSLGRFTQKNPIGAIDYIRPKSYWRIVGGLGIITAFFILSYYSVIGGWTIGYIIQMFLHIEPNINSFNANPLNVIGYLALFISLIMIIVIKGVKQGIERFNKIIMPLLFILLLILIFRSLTFSNSLSGLKYYLMPDFSKITAKTFIMALGQAFFSLSIGEAVLITYGSYTKKNENLFSSAFYVVIFDTLVALLAGLVIFPSLFAFGHTPKGGIELIFVVLPQIFLKMPFGMIFGGFFFLLLSFAAISTGIALLEMPVIYLIQQKKWSRKKAVWVTGAICFLFGIPSALSQGANPFLSHLHLRFMNITGFYNIMDFIWGNLGMICGGFFLSLFIGWVWKPTAPAKELSIGSKYFFIYSPIWVKTIRYFAPLAIIAIFLNLFL